MRHSKPCFSHFQWFQLQCHSGLLQHYHCNSGPSYFNIILYWIHSISCNITHIPFFLFHISFMASLLFIEYTLILKTDIFSVQATQCPSLVLQGSPIAKKSSAFSLLFARFVWWACIVLPHWQPNLCLTGNLCLSGNLIHSFVSHRSSHCISRYDASHFSSNTESSSGEGGSKMRPQASQIPKRNACRLWV